MNRSIQKSISIEAGAEQIFKTLITPSSIVAWWNASDAIILPQKHGLYAVRWGHMDNPEYLSIARISEIQAPLMISLDRYLYDARKQALPFEAEFEVRFEILPINHGCELRVTQSGFPQESIADEFFNACDLGWTEVLENIRNFLQAVE